MLKIRLQRVGRKHEPKFRLVLTDSKNSTKSGKILEILGNLDARHAETAVFKGDRIKHWISSGAQATPTVFNFLIDKKIVEGKKLNVLPKKRPIMKESGDRETPQEKPKENTEENTETDLSEEVMVPKEKIETSKVEEVIQE